MAGETITLTPQQLEEQSAPVPTSGGNTLTVSPSQLDSMGSSSVTQTQAKPQTSTIGPSPQPSDINNADLAKTVSGGNPVSYAAARLSIPAIKSLLKIHDAIKGAENLTEQGREAHPIVAKLGDTAAAIEGLLVGQTNRPDEAIGSGQFGVLNNPATAAITPVGDESVGAKVAEKAGPAVEEGAEAVKGGVAGAVNKARSVARDIREGEGVAQPGAQGALRSLANEPSGSLSDTLQTDLSKIESQKTAAYRAADESAGLKPGDLQNIEDQLSNVQEEIRTKKGVMSEKRYTALQGKENVLQSRIAEIQGKAGDAYSKASALNTKLKAGEQIQREIFHSPSVVQGVGENETVNIDNAINAIKKLKFSERGEAAKFGEGNRWDQYFGDGSADKVLSQLEQYQKLGVHAVKMQRFAKWVGGIAGVGAVEEGIRHAAH